MTKTEAIKAIRALGITVSYRDGEFVVGANGIKGAGYFTSDAADAVATARLMLGWSGR